jgi:hypothetical protein
LELTQPPVQWVRGAFPLGVKRLEHEALHSSPSSAEVKNAWSDTSTHPISLYGVVLPQNTGITLRFSLPYERRNIFPSCDTPLHLLQFQSG